MYVIKTNSPHSFKNKKRTIPKLPLIVAGILLILVILVVLELTNTSHVFHTAPEDRPTKTASQDTKGEPSTPTPTDTTPPTTPSEQPGEDKNPTGAPSSGKAPAEPTGNFVSDYQPSLNGYTLTSVCVTTPGATCQISFTKGSVTKSLDAETADSGGSVYWQGWSLKDLGMSAGSWTIKATATLNGKTSSTTDSLTLNVQP